MQFQSLENAMNFAIEKEQRAYNTYNEFRKIVKDMAAQKLLKSLAEQELGHKTMLEDVLKTGRIGSIGGKKKISEVSFSDYIIEKHIGPDSNPQDVMQFAMRMEQSAYSLYQELLANYSGTELESLFDRLSKEELKHKDILEEQYDKHFMQWM